MLLNDKVAIVTGADGPVGQATAIRFAEEGATVVLVAGTPSSEEGLAERASAGGGHTSVEVADVTSEDQARSLLERVAGRHGRIDILVNAAVAQGPARDLVGLPMADWDRVVDLNLRATALWCKYALRTMCAAGGGVILNVSSVNGRRGAPGQSADSASRWAVIGLTQSLAWEAGPHGVRVNCIVPGAFEGGAAPEDALAAAYRETVERITAVRPARRVTMDEVADLAVYLASDRAVAMTGQTINADAGAWYS